MNIKELRQLMQLMERHQVSEIKLEGEEGTVHLKRDLGQPMGAPAYMPAPSAALPPGYPPAPSYPAGAQSAPEAAEPVPQPSPTADDNLIPITSPIVGTFYRAPAPDASPFVEVGDTVEAGQTVCIVEAMKLMNEIEAPSRGRVHAILIENDNPVEYGETIIILEKL